MQAVLFFFLNYILSIQPLDVTYPGVVFDQPMPLVSQKICRDLLSHKIHTVLSAFLLQVLTYDSTEGHQAGNSAPVGGPVCEEATGYSTDESHIIPSIIQ